MNFLFVRHALLITKRVSQKRPELESDIPCFLNVLWALLIFGDKYHFYCPWATYVRRWLDVAGDYTRLDWVKLCAGIDLVSASRALLRTRREIAAYDTRWVGTGACVVHYVPSATAAADESWRTYCTWHWHRKESLASPPGSAVTLCKCILTEYDSLLSSLLLFNWHTNVSLCACYVSVDKAEE